jgi:hypothetical protein
MKKEIEEITKFFEIKSIKNFEEKECSTLALAYGGLNYHQEINLKNKEDRVKII